MDEEAKRQNSPDQGAVVWIRPRGRHLRSQCSPIRRIPTPISPQDRVDFLEVMGMYSGPEASRSLHPSLTSYFVLKAWEEFSPLRRDKPVPRYSNGASHCTSAGQPSRLHGTSFRHAIYGDTEHSLILATCNPSSRHGPIERYTDRVSPDQFAAISHLIAKVFVENRVSFRVVGFSSFIELLEIYGLLWSKEPPADSALPFPAPP
jgi:hypothetical protein